MALIKGICKNYGECDLADNKEIQEVDKTNFVCEECGKPLHPVEGGSKPSGKIGKGPNWKLIGLIGGVVAVIGIGTYFLWPKEKPQENEPKEKPQLSLNHLEKALKVGEADTLKATVSPEGTQATIVWKASKDGTVEVQDGIVKAVKGGSGKVRVQAIVGKDTLSAICKYTVDVVEDSIPPKGGGSGPGGQDPKPFVGPSVSWGKYEGPANGLGGTIKVTRSYSLDLHNDGEALELSPGDEIQQTKFTNGELRGGVWVHDGSRRSFTR